MGAEDMRQDKGHQYRGDDGLKSDQQRAQDENDSQGDDQLGHCSPTRRGRRLSLVHKFSLSYIRSDRRKSGKLDTQAQDRIATRIHHIP